MMKAVFCEKMKRWNVSFYVGDKVLLEATDESLNKACAMIFRMKTEG